MSTKGKKSNSKKARAAKKRKGIILLVVEILLLAVVGVVVWMVFQGTNKVEKVNTDGNVATNSGVDEYFESQKTVVDEVTGEVTTRKGFRTIALFGVDSRNNQLSSNTRTDTIIIAAINQDTGEVKMVSLLRDTYLNLTDGSYNKCNAAYAFGGPVQAINMLNTNLDLNIQDYVTIGFTGVRSLVDAVGGVEINVRSNEISHLNNYQISMVGTSEDGINFTATPYVDYIPVEMEGPQVLNGLQATGYCRIRYVGNDFARTQRQRTVITQIINKAKTLNPVMVSKIVQDTLGYVSTSLDIDELLSLAASLSSYTVQEESYCFPFDEIRTGGMIGAKGSCVVPATLTDNVVRLHEFLYGTENYVPSQTVQECSAKIQADTAPYLGGGQ